MLVSLSDRLRCTNQLSPVTEVTPALLPLVVWSADEAIVSSTMTHKNKTIIACFIGAPRVLFRKHDA
jgi:hypothetical protein